MSQCKAMHACTNAKHHCNQIKTKQD